METNIMLEALADAYRMATIEKNTIAQELAKCKEELQKLQVIVGSIAPSEATKETSSKSNSESQGSTKKSAKPAAKGDGARKK
jgi:hypothetical protein